MVAKMMAKEPERRFQTPAEVAQALMPFFKQGRLRSLGLECEVSQRRAPEARTPRPCRLPPQPRQAGPHGPCPRATSTV